MSLLGQLLLLSPIVILLEIYLAAIGIELNNLNTTLFSSFPSETK